MQTWEVAITIIGILLIIAAAYFTTYYIASRNSNRIARGRSIKMHDSFALSKEKLICVVEVTGKVYVLAMSSGVITVLDSLDAAEYEDVKEKYTKNMAPTISIETVQNSFSAVKNSAILQKMINVAKRKKPDLTEELKKENTVQLVQEEDGIDAVYRKIQTRRLKQDKN